MPAKASAWLMMFLLVGVHIRCCGNGYLGFRPYGGSPFPNAGVPAQRKGNPKGFALTSGPLAKARGSFAPESIRGIDSGLLRCTSFRCPPRMNPCTQPPDGLSRSRTALELTLIVLSGEKQGRWGLCFCFSVGASLLAIAIYQTQLILRMYPNPCGSWLASDDGGTFNGNVGCDPKSQAQKRGLSSPCGHALRNANPQ